MFTNTQTSACTSCTLFLATNGCSTLSSDIYLNSASRKNNPKCADHAAYPTARPTTRATCANHRAAICPAVTRTYPAVVRFVVVTVAYTRAIALTANYLSKFIVF